MVASRVIPAGVLREMNREVSGESLLLFLDITHDDLNEPIRVVSDPIDHVWLGNTYQGFVFNMNLLTDDENAPWAQLSIQNVDRMIGDTLRRVTNPARITLSIIAASEFDQTVNPRTELTTAVTTYVASGLYLVDVEVTAMHVQGRLRLWDYSQEQWPAVMGTRDRLPALFR